MGALLELEREKKGAGVNGTELVQAHTLLCPMPLATVSKTMRKLILQVRSPGARTVGEQHD